MTMVFGRPATVSGFVVPVVIDTIERVLSTGTFAHISEEIFEDQPTFTDNDAAASVPSPLDGFRVETSLLHSSPRMIGRSELFPSIATSVAVSCFDNAFISIATAANCVIASQIIADSDNFDATITKTNPPSIFGLSMRETDNDQAPESLTNEIQGGAHV